MEYSQIPANMATVLVIIVLVEGVQNCNGCSSTSFTMPERMLNRMVYGFIFYIDFTRKAKLQLYKEYTSCLAYVFSFEITCHSLENKILCLSRIQIGTFSRATIKQRNDTLGNDTWFVKGKHYAKVEKVYCANYTMMSCALVY